MSRRASLPGASELFRSTGRPAFRDILGDDVSPPPAPATGSGGGGTSSAPAAPSSTGADGRDGRRRLSNAAAAVPRKGSGRQKHDAKITVYMSADELLAIEQARLTLRAAHDLKTDRGRIVREALAVLLADFDEHGEDSVLVKRLRHGDLDPEEAAT